MTASFSLSIETMRAFPEAQIRFVTAHELDNAHPWNDVETAIQELEAKVRVGAWRPYDEASPEIASWHDAYRRFGSNPRRVRPSVDALGRRLAKTGRLPRINPAVDAYNLVSLTHGVPAGAFNLDAIGGPVVIRLGQPNDKFSPLGEPAVVEHPSPTEVVYATGDTVLTRHWNHRDCDLTKVTERSQNVIFILERVSSTAVPTSTLASAQAMLLRLLTPHAGSVRTAVIEAETPSTWLEVGEPGLAI